MEAPISLCGQKRTRTGHCSVGQDGPLLSCGPGTSLDPLADRSEKDGRSCQRDRRHCRPLLEDSVSGGARLLRCHRGKNHPIVPRYDPINNSWESILNLTFCSLTLQSIFPNTFSYWCYSRIYFVWHSTTQLTSISFKGFFFLHKHRSSRCGRTLNSLGFGAFGFFYFICRSFAWRR